MDNNTEIDISNNLYKLLPPKNQNFVRSGTFKDGINIIDKNIINKGRRNAICANYSSLNKNNLYSMDSNIRNDSYKKQIARKSKFSISNNLNYLIKEKVDSRSNINLKEKIDLNIINNKEKNIRGANESKNVKNKSNNDKFKFYHYLCYLISLNKNNSKLQLYHNFRIKMISEENLILSNLNINELMQKYKNILEVGQELEGNQNLF